MDIVIDGSYTSDSPDMIGCGVIVMDRFGFYTEHRFQIKHIAASSSFAEWYGLECAFDMILAKEINVSGETEINIYTDCQSILDVMVNRKGLYSKNELLHNYISKIILLYTNVKLYSKRECNFHHIKQDINKMEIIRLHKRAHVKAQIPRPRTQAHGNVQRPEKHEGLPEQVYLQIKLEPVVKGRRKWTIYENHEPVHSGKLRTILSRYQKERYDIKTLESQKRLQTDKGTRRILKKYIGSV